MNFKKKIFLLSLLGILILIIFSQNLIQTEISEIKKIYFSKERAIIETTDNKTLILFSPGDLNLKEGNRIEFKGRGEFYRGEKQVIVDKLWKF